MARKKETDPNLENADPQARKTSSGLKPRTMRANVSVSESEAVETEAQPASAGEE